MIPGDQPGNPQHEPVEDLTEENQETEMQRNSVVSPSIAKMGYDRETGTLEVEFTSGPVYQYYDFPEDMYVKLKSQSSKGQFLEKEIKNAYAYSRVG